jgi:hypothetical protein
MPAQRAPASNPSSKPRKATPIVKNTPRRAKSEFIKPTVVTQAERGSPQQGVLLNPVQTDADVHVEKGSVTGRFVRYRTLSVLIVKKSCG